MDKGCDWRGLIREFFEISTFGHFLHGPTELLYLAQVAIRFLVIAAKISQIPEEGHTKETEYCFYQGN
jgi:hypothetical protein